MNGGWEIMPGPVALPEALRLERTGLGRTIPRRQFLSNHASHQQWCRQVPPPPKPDCCPCSLKSSDLESLQVSRHCHPCRFFPNSSTWFSEPFQFYMRFYLVSELIFYGEWLHLPGDVRWYCRGRFSHVYAVGIWYWGDTWNVTHQFCLNFGLHKE